MCKNKNCKECSYEEIEKNIDKQIEDLVNELNPIEFELIRIMILDNIRKIKRSIVS